MLKAIGIVIVMQRPALYISYRRRLVEEIEACTRPKRQRTRR
jgi:hypothetical protein